jgi:hypothetical protein
MLEDIVAWIILLVIIAIVLTILFFLLVGFLELKDYLERNFGNRLKQKRSIDPYGGTGRTYHDPTAGNLYHVPTAGRDYAASWRSQSDAGGSSDI